jgi:cytoskeletal protein RodZ
MRHWLLTAVLLTAVFSFAQSQSTPPTSDQKAVADNSATAAPAGDTKPEAKTEAKTPEVKTDDAKADTKAAPKSDAKPADAKAPDVKTADAKSTGSNGCLAVKPIGSHAFRNIMLAGVAGALISKQQYQVVDVVNYPSHVGTKFHGNDLQTISSNGTKVVILDKKYKEEDVQKACH